MVLKIPQVGIKQSSWQNRPSTCSMWELSVHTSPGPPQDGLGELQAKQKLPHDRRHMLTEHRWQQHLEQNKGRWQLWSSIGQAGDSDPTLGQVLDMHTSNF